MYNRLAITLKSLTGEVSNTDPIVTFATVNRWDIREQVYSQLMRLMCWKQEKRGKWKDLSDFDKGQTTKHFDPVVFWGLPHM